MPMAWPKHADAGPRFLLADIFAEDRDAPFGGAGQARDDAQQGGLTRAVAAQERSALPGSTGSEMSRSAGKVAVELPDVLDRDSSAHALFSERYSKTKPIASISEADAEHGLDALVDARLDLLDTGGRRPLRRRRRCLPAAAQLHAANPYLEPRMRGLVPFNS